MKTTRQAVHAALLGASHGTALCPRVGADGMEHTEACDKVTAAIEQRDEEARAERPLQDAGLVEALEAAVSSVGARWRNGEVSDKTFVDALLAAYRTSKPTPPKDSHGSRSVRRADAAQNCAPAAGEDAGTTSQPSPPPGDRISADELASIRRLDYRASPAQVQALVQEVERMWGLQPTPTRAVTVRAEGDAGTLPSTQIPAEQRETCSCISVGGNQWECCACEAINDDGWGRCSCHHVRSPGEERRDSNDPMLDRLAAEMGLPAEDDLEDLPDCMYGDHQPYCRQYKPPAEALHATVPAANESGMCLATTTAGAATVGAPATPPTAETCDGSGLVGAIDWVECHPYQSTAPCPGCPACAATEGGKP